MEIDLEKIKPVLRRIEGYLDKMELNYGEIEVDEIPAIVLSFTFDDKEDDEKRTNEMEKTGIRNQFLVIITTDGEWIAIKSLVGSVKDLPSKHLCEIYQDCLQANYALEEVTFSADKEGDIFVEADMLSDTRFEDFREEFSSIVLGMRVFIDIIKKYGVGNVDTSQHKDSKEFHHITLKDVIYR